LKDEIPMTMSLSIRDLMIPLTNAAVAGVDTPLKEAIAALRKVYCEVDEGKCTEAGFRVILVRDGQGRIVGILDFQDVIRGLIPEIAGGFPDKLRALWNSLGAAGAMSGFPEDAEQDLKARVMRNAERPLGEFMQKLKGAISADADVLEALITLREAKVSALPVYDGDQPVGVIRDSDLFLKIADILFESQ
jgi:CBS domain-containing protein